MRDAQSAAGTPLGRLRRRLHSSKVVCILVAMLKGKTILGDIVKACLIWMGLAFSLGFYYVFTYYGRSGWPMPLPESCAALVFYYFSVLNVDTAYQAIHWLVAFPLAGVLWVTTLTLTAPFFGGVRTEYAWTLLRFSKTCLPLIAPAPVLVLYAAHSTAGFSVMNAVSVALRRGGGTMPGAWLTPLYVGLGVACLVWQILLYVKLFDLHGKKAFVHYATGVVLLVIFVSGLATLLSFPLRYWLETAAAAL